MNVNVVNVRNVYERNVVVNSDHVAFNGGNGGVQARPTREEERYANEPHTAPLAAQAEHEHAASQNRSLFASENHGRPAIAATGRPGEFSGHNVVAARATGAAHHEPRMSPQEARVSSNENRGNENRNAENRNNENRGNEMRNQSRNENNREMSRPQNRGNNTQARQDKAEQRQQQQQARQEQKQQRQQQKQQAQQQKAERQQAQRAQKQQRQEQKREGRGPGR